VAAHSFDPEGKKDQGDPAKQENENLAYLAIDRDPTTPWQTTHYKDKDITGFKGGVGLYLELRSPAQARSLELDVPTPGAEISVYGADGDRPPETLAGWQGPLAGPDQVDEQHSVISLDTKRPYRYYLIWFTELPDSPDGGYRGAIGKAVLKP
jgi:hypothetical protein